MSFDVVLCKYGLLLVKLLSMSMREIIWVVILEYLLEPIHIMMLMMSWVISPMK